MGLKLELTIRTEGMPVEGDLPFVVAVTEQDPDGSVDDNFVEVMAPDARTAAVKFVAAEVYRNDWHFIHDSDAEQRIALKLAEGFLARRLPENWTVEDFEGQTFREVVSNPKDARTFTIGFIAPGEVSAESDD